MTPAHQVGWRIRGSAEAWLAEAGLEEAEAEPQKQCHGSRAAEAAGPASFLRSVARDFSILRGRCLFTAAGTASLRFQPAGVLLLLRVGRPRTAVRS